jgi:hypothetical protein
MEVLPDPESKVPGLVVYEDEIPALRALGDAFSPLMGELGDAPDGVYMADRRWIDVLVAAHNAYLVMLANDQRAGVEQDWSTF